MPSALAPAYLALVGATAPAMAGGPFAAEAHATLPDHLAPAAHLAPAPDTAPVAEPPADDDTTDDDAGLAQDATPADAGGTGTAAPVAVTNPRTGVQRQFLMEIGFRGRYLSIPDSILDFWYFDNDGEESDPSPLPRPEARAYAFGLEYALRKNPANWIFYGEYLGNLVEDGYWDDVEEPSNHNDGDYIVPDGWGMVIVGANYAHEVTATPWLGFQFGGGLGVGVITGGLIEWNPGNNAADSTNTDPDCAPQSAAYERYEICPDDGYKRLPPVLPMVDITASARFNFSEHAHLRIDGGLHDMLYFGAAMGAVF